MSTLVEKQEASLCTDTSPSGHYIPGSSHHIWQQNKKLAVGEPKRINLKGIAIGNGLTNPNIQYKYNQDMVDNQYNITLLTNAQAAQMKKDSVECIALTELFQSSPTNGTICVDAQGCWQEKLIAPFNDVHRNLYDFRVQCSPDQLDECGPSYAFLGDYFGLEVVKKHVPVFKHPWHEGDQDVYANYVSSGDLLGDETIPFPFESGLLGPVLSVAEIVSSVKVLT